MGIQNYLKRVSKATKDIKSAIEEKGVSVAQCDGFETLANKVRAIQTGTGSDGSSLFTVLAFKSSQTKPATPTGGSFTTSAISYPSGWSDGSGLSKYVWMSYIVFKGDGSVYKNWVSPILVNGIINDGGDPIDLTDLATRTWVTDQIKNAIKNGIIDLSTYATKSYVDQKISEIPGGGGNFVESINGATGAITFAGSGVSKSGNTFTFNGGSGSGTTTSINGETGELTFTGSGVSKNGKTFTFSGGSSTEVTKDYVDTQDASTLQSAKDYADGLVSSTGVSSLNGLTGAIRITPGSSNVSIASSEDQVLISVSGGGDGDPGQDGDTYRTFNIYQNTNSDEVIPSISSGAVPPTWDTVNNKLLNCPTGWATDQTYEKGKYTWMASGTFSKKSGGSMIEDWIGPICITGEKGVPGADGSSLEFIYTLTANETSIPAYPLSLSDLKTLFDATEGGDSTEHYAEYQGQKWYDRAQSIDPDNYRTCWMAQRVKIAGATEWTYYSPRPVIWANWGSDGQDGDGVEYIFFTTDDAHKDSNGKWYSDDPNYTISYTKPGTVQGVSTNYDNTIDDWVPYGWLDEPVDIDKNIAFFEFCAVRKSENGVWKEFSTPILWDLAVNDGSDGSGFEQVFALYRDLVDNNNMSVDNASANADNAHTTDEYLPQFIFNGASVQSTDDPQSVSSTTPYQYVSVRRKPRGINTEWGDFSHPRLYNNYTKPAIDEATLQELKDTATNAAHESIENAVSDINTAKSDIAGMQQALGYKDGTYKRLNDYDETSNTLTTQLGSVKTEQDTIKSNISTLQQSDTAITQRVAAQETKSDEINTKVANLTTSVDSINGQVTTLNEWKDGGWKNDLKTSGLFISSDQASNFATNTDFETVTSGLNKVTANMNQMSNIYGRYLMNTDGDYVDGNGYIIYTNSDASSALYYKVVENVGKYFTYNKEDKTYAEYTESVSDYHKIGKDLFSDDEIQRDTARTEISKYGVIIADNIAAVSTKVSESASQAQLTAAVNDVKQNMASIAVSAAKGELSKATITADRVSFGSKSLAEAVTIDATTGKVLADSLETKDDGAGSVKIIDDQVALLKGSNVVFKLSGSDISSGGSSTTQLLSGNRIQGASDNSNDMSDQILKQHQASYSWSKTVSLGNISGATDKLIIAPSESFMVDFSPSFDASEYISTPDSGTLDVSVRRTIGGASAGSIYKSFLLNYHGGRWDYFDVSGSEISGEFILPSRTVIGSSDSLEVSYIIEAEATVLFNSSVESSKDGANFDTTSMIYSVQNSGNRTFQIVDQDSGTAIGTNGFKVALDGANRAQFVKSGSNISLILESPSYGVEVTSDNLWLKVGGKWYTPQPTASGLTFTETKKS